MNESRPDATTFAIVAALFEGGLAVAAVLLGWLVGVHPLATLTWDPAAVLWGLIGVLPPLGLFVFCLLAPWKPFRRLRHVVDRQLTPWLTDLRLAELAAISLLAGVGEELLFRGVIQAGASQWIGGQLGIALGLALASLLFAFAHAITPTYLALAGAISLYLGGLWLWTGNLLVPITAHAVYDLVGMIYLTRMRNAASSREEK